VSKKLKIIILIILFGYKISNSQIIDQFGIRTGGSISQINWNYSNFFIDKIDFQKRIGFSFQAYADLLDKKYLNITTGLGYIEKGGVLNVTLVNEYGDPIGKSKRVSKINYLTYNIQLKGKYTLKKIVSYISIGPRIDFTIKYDNIFQEIHDYDKLNEIIYGFVYSIGTGYELKKIMIFMDFSKNINLNKIANFTNSTSNIGVNVNDDTMILSIGVSIKINKDDDK